MTAGRASGPAPEVSVVVPTFRRPELLARCVERLFAQTLVPDRYEIVIVDDGRDDATRDRVDRLRAAAPDGAPLRYVRPTGARGPAAARNAGWRAATAPLVAFTDDDTLPDAAWLDEGLGAMATRPGFAAVCGRIVVPLDPPAGRRPTDHERMTMGLESAEFVTANAFVRRAALERIGGFDETFTRAWREDSDLQFRLMRDAGPVERVATATVLHPARAERWGICLRQQKNAYFEALLYKKHPRLYRERIGAGPPWDYYGIVGLSVASAVFIATGRWAAGAIGAAAGLGLVLRFAARRLAPTSRAPAHVWEMLATSAVIPFLSVYWRLRGAWRFRVAFF